MYKKITLCLLLLASGTNFSFSQEKKDGDNRKLIFGLKTGANFSWYKSDSRNLDKGGFKPGFAYGIMCDYQFQPNYLLSTEFLVSTLNGKLKFRDTLTYKRENKTARNTNVIYEYSVRYIQIPVSFKFKTKEIGMMKYHAQFGVAPGVKVSSKTDIIISGNNAVLWPEEDIKNIKTNKEADEGFEPAEFDDDISFINLPLIIGGGVEYNLSGNTSLYGNLRFENGFNNILQSKTGFKTIAYSKNISLSVGIMF